MKYKYLIIFISIFSIGCKTPQALDTALVNKAIDNAELSHESFQRSLDFTHAWLQKTDPDSGLIPSNLNNRTDLWDPANAAADNYPFMVLTAYLLDTDLLNGTLLDILHQEKTLTSRVGVLPDVYSFSKNDFNEYPLNLGHVIFGASEYIKDGLIPLNELMGASPWQERMMEMLDELFRHTDDFTELEKYFKRASSVEEINGEMLQILSRVYWMTGKEKYLNWAIKIADHYLLEMDFSQTDYLRLRDHGCEIIGGLSELFLTLHRLEHPKVEDYRPPFYRLLDRILVYGRNNDGLFYNAINLKTKTPVDDRIADNWGYILNAYYTTWMVDQKVEYIQAVRKPFKALNLNYRNYNWEPGAQRGPLGSHDGYADAIESGINLLNRENDPDLRTWIDSEIKVMFGMQQPDGIVEGWHGDGNFARTALMYGLWKTQGARLSPWKPYLRLGAVASEKETYFVLTTQTDWEGKLIFDPIRHKTILNLPVDYPRINQFPEWFTADPQANYRITASDPKLSNTYNGVSLLEGIPIKLRPGERLIIKIQ
jgi:nicotinamide riboside kinase